ncbi:hypothetical protein E9993_21890 [Labilibacter sediminis]|nr:hypothetical protein E9993_21890 [Labilibacter sediminis]
MKDKKQHIDHESEFIKNLFDDFSPSSPSPDFKKITMDKVMHEWSNQPIYTSSKLSTNHKIWLGAAVAFSLLLVYLFDVKDIAGDISITNNIELTNTQNSFTKSFESLANAFAQVPALVYIVSVGISAIIFLDKMMNKLSSRSL